MISFENAINAKDLLKQRTNRQNSFPVLWLFSHLPNGDLIFLKKYENNRKFIYVEVNFYMVIYTTYTVDYKETISTSVPIKVGFSNIPQF